MSLFGQGRIRAAVFSASLLCPGMPLPASQRSAPQLVLPVACEIGASCLIQKLVDHDTGPGRRDYRCGTLTTDGHDGIDIRLRTMQDMAQGYAVIAAAAGVVLRVRDGEPDISSRLRTVRDGRDAGNGVVIAHGGGWETQYSHLKSGSVAVRPGQRIEAGERLGLVGLSGNSEFPHLHFSVRLNGGAIDPFTGGPAPAACGPRSDSQALWKPKTASALRYVGTTVISAALASAAPARSVAERAGATTQISRDASLLLWVDAIGARDGDVQHFSIAGPDGKAVHSQQVRVDSGGLSWFAFSGKKAPPNGWSGGRYIGSYTLKREGVTVANAVASVVVR